MSKSSFLTYRYTVIENPGSFKYGKDKIKAFRDIIDELLENKKVHYFFKDQKDVYFFADFKNNFIKIKVAIQKLLVKHDLEATDVKEHKEEDYPYNIVLLNIEKQLLFFKKNHGRINYKEVMTIFGSYFKSRLLDLGFIFEIFPVSKQSDFWKIVRTPNVKIFKLNLIFNTPNWLNGNSKLEAYSKSVRDEFNADMFGLNFESNQGNLNIDEKLEPEIEYISAGNGNYKMRYSHNGKTQTLSNEELSHEVNISDELNESEVGNAFEKAHEIYKQD